MKTSCVALSLLLMAVSALSASAWAARNGSVSGVVTDKSGKPVSGAYVKLTEADRGLLFMVISQGQGKFQATQLPPGTYSVQGVGGGLQSEPSPVKVNDNAVTANVSLTAQQPEFPPISEYAKALPEGEGRKIILTKCGACHDIRKVVDRRSDREAWQARLTQMRRFMKATPDVRGLTDDEEKTLLDYLVKNFGPDLPLDKSPQVAPNAQLSRTLLTGDAAKYRVMEYKLPPKAGPHDVAVDAKGIAWVGERPFGIGRLDPVALTYTRIPVPKAKNKYIVNGIAVDPQGYVWTAEGGNKRLLRYDPKAEKFTSYEIPNPKEESTVNTIRFHPNGSVWASQIGDSRVARLDPPSKEFHFYPSPHPDGRPYGLTIDPAGKVWFVEFGEGKVGRIDPQSGKIDEFDVPAKRHLMRRADTDAHGNVWFGVHLENRLGRVDGKTQKITLYTPPTPGGGPYSISIDKKNDLVWFNEQQVSKIVRLNPRTNTFTEYTLPTRTDSRRIEVDPTNPNRIWYSGGGEGYDKAGYIEIIE